MHLHRWIRHILVVLVLLSHVSLGSSYRILRDFESPGGCSFVKCKRNERCVNRKFLCERYPCPSMLYCAKTRTELLRGPVSCDTVRCTKGHVCVIRVRHCSWNESCGDRVARCVTEQEYYDGPATCAGFHCASGQRCILRESLCTRPPCKLFKSCANTQEVHVWMDRCKSLGCVSQFECFLRRPRENCRPPHCQHTPDCIATTEKELLASEKCNGWVCPKGQQCAYQVQSPCTSDNCRITRSCHGRPSPMNDSSMPTAHYRQMEKMRFFDPSAQRPLPSAPWMDNFRARSNAQAVKYLVKETRDELPYNDTEFHQWLNSVKDILGQKAYNLWLEEIRTITIHNKPFHDWFRTLNPRNTTVGITQQEKPFWNILRRNDYHPSHERLSENNEFDVRDGNRYRNVFTGDRRQMELNQLLSKLREGRHLYLNVINKTNELVSTVEQLLPSFHLDQGVKDVQRLPEARKSLEESPDTTSTDQNTTPNPSPKTEDYQTGDYSDDNDNDFVLVDYGEGGQIEVNETIPRVIIRVENNMHQPIKIGNIHLQYEENEDHTENQNQTRSVYEQNDYDVDEFQYFRPPVPKNNTKTNTHP
ncbi:uncharacterized protein LOC107047782 [Diachasma alloeum]|uniref:uncharacterized protein LOC107047782 n=1 Tax=Diachasma alloeum TaxID=454923 RepID=UPI0007381B4F|nr:uncharacterized protein LOC107047782 [Diachasma alloeum]